ncbi:MAG TPA: DegT/DnrJ/EryC1/StrS family aminotransferase, partial [Phycisphaerae bacterium]|nr:DegT/DnrJ/EryC1/StrS family aminotransferase [Phycisphaerae bacterium]
MGHLCDMKALGAIAKKHTVMIIEDACQAVGGSYLGRRAGSIGKAGAFSFNYFKNITCGEGGAVLTSDGVIFDRARIYHDGGCVFRQYASEIETPFFTGSNFRVSEIQGAILSAQLERLDGILKRLRARFKAMNEVLAKSKRFALSPLNDAEGDCGSSVLVTFEKEAEAKAYLDRHQNHGASLGRPIDTGRHVYCNWEPIMNRRGAHHAKLNPYNWAKREIRYAADMCPRSLDLMSRTVFASVPYKASIGEARRLAKALAE